MNKEKYYELLNEKKIEELYIRLEEEIKNILIKVLKINNIDVNNIDSFQDIAEKVINFDREYTLYMAELEIGLKGNEFSPKELIELVEKIYDDISDKYNIEV